MRGELRRFDPDTGVERCAQRFDDTVSAVATRRDGWLRVAVGLRVLDLDDPGGRSMPVTSLAAAAGEPLGNRCNDGGCDPSGRYWIGTMERSAAPGCGALYRLERDGPVKVLSGVSVSNGIGWDRAGTSMYYVDSFTGDLEVFDHDPATGHLDRRRTHAVISRVDGQVPDGLAMDAEDGIWLAVWGAGALHRYDEAGVLTHVAELPTTHPTSCGFGGDRLDVLYCTSASLHDRGADQLSGALLALDVGVCGQPVREVAVHPPTPR